jgi:hypothetical protein
VRCEKGLPVITFYFYQTDHFVSQKRVFFSKFSVKFEKFAQFDFLKKISQLLKKYVIYCLN